MTTSTPVERAQRAFMTPRGAILALLLVGVLFSSVYPIRRYFQVRSSIAQLQHEDRALDQRTQQLTKQKASLQSDAEVETIARQDLGYVRPGHPAERGSVDAFERRIRRSLRPGADLETWLFRADLERFRARCSYHQLSASSPLTPLSGPA